MTRWRIVRNPNQATRSVSTTTMGPFQIVFEISESTSFFFCDPPPPPPPENNQSEAQPEITGQNSTLNCGLSPEHVAYTLTGFSPKSFHRSERDSSLSIRKTISSQYSFVWCINFDETRSITCVGRNVLFSLADLKRHF